MTAHAVVGRRSRTAVLALGDPTRSERHAVIAVGTYAVALFVFPSNMVLEVVGGQGSVAGLLALTLFVVYVASTLMGSHDPLTVRHPTRGALFLLTVMSLVAWALTPFHGLTATQQVGADRWVLMLAGFAGVVLVAAEGLRTVDGLVRVLRLVVRGAAFCCAVALVQWLFRFDLSALLRQSLPGFSVQLSHDVYEDRAALQRVFGTTAHPIELGVIAGMLLPLALVLATQDRSHSPVLRWGPVVLIATAIPASVARSAVLAVIVSSAVLVACLPARPRVTAMVLLPLGTFVVGLARPGYLRTLADLVGAGADDASLQGRLVDLPLVGRLVSEHPWFGTGPGTYTAANALDIFDNQYYTSATELGLLGLTGLLAWYLVPVVTAAAARHRSSDPPLRAVAGALAGAATASAVCAFTFDGLSFNMYAGLQALVVGCIGTCWILSGREGRVARAAGRDAHPAAPPPSHGS
ncbi:O-antigen ligase [Geodermatophilus normandii]|uniref:O-antigen ligase n=1 Tax=Geodermatophilus normandii TaxID=1137989 RepID=A0A317QF67_9ACTN|nr:O-antigen ligase [Geodermatophilus normandii]